MNCRKMSSFKYLKCILPEGKYQTLVVVFELLFCLFLPTAQPHRSKKCKCLNGSISHIKLELLRKISVPVFHKPSSFCPQLEIIM